MRIVIKVGTSTLAHATGRLNIQRMERLCKVLSDLKNAGYEIILVSSGAIGMVTKLHAAQIATAAGCEMVIANGEKPEVLYDIVDGRRAGTRFLIPHS